MTQTKTAKNQKRTRVKPLSAPAIAVCSVLIGVGFICLCSALWYSSVYGQTGFDSILFTLQSSMSGVQSDLALRYFSGALLPALFWTTIVNLFLFFRRKNSRTITFFGKYTLRLPKLSRIVTVVCALTLTVVLLCVAGWNTGFFEYVVEQFTESELFEHYYVDPDNVNISFPEKKRNLVYIMLESMEISYLSKELGGAMETNLIPELYEIARDNINFSHNSGVGGFHEASGASWTIGSIVAQTAGIPLKTPEGLDDWQNGYGKDGVFLPGVTSITNILSDAGYYTTFLCGSDANFGGRKTYYMTHGMDHVYDVYTARKDGIIPKDYFVWWGYEDLYLFDYAKQELTEIAAQDQPFAFTMLTVDTHHIGGYQCVYCTDEYEETYEQSISCSSRQVLAFLQWLQAQPFYENTTVIITGDHRSMDRGYFSRTVDEDYNRMVYNVIINAPVEPVSTKNRSYCAMDLFPTTLAALGCEIEGNRLGLGTNLFSNLPTLSEKMGFRHFDQVLSLSSDYYSDHFYEEKSDAAE